MGSWDLKMWGFWGGVPEFEVLRPHNLYLRWGGGGTP